MFLKISFLILALPLFDITCGVYVYSSFWAPLFNPRILNYKVDAQFDPDSGRNAREDYERAYGYRGANLIEDLGNGKEPVQNKNENYQDVKFSYTYPGAYGNYRNQ